MTKDLGSSNSNKRFLAAEGNSVSLSSLDKTMDGLEVLPDKAADSGVLRNCLKGTVRKFVSRFHWGQGPLETGDYMVGTLWN